MLQENPWQQRSHLPCETKNGACVPIDEMRNSESRDEMHFFFNTAFTADRRGHVIGHEAEVLEKHWRQCRFAEAVDAEDRVHAVLPQEIADAHCRRHARQRVARFATHLRRTLCQPPRSL